MTQRQVAEELRRRARALKEELRRAEGETVRHGQTLGKRMSEGPYKQAQLDRMGNPYSLRRSNPPMHPAIINRQTGAFWRGWRRTLGHWRGGRLVSFIYNLDPKARWLVRGTTRMIRRPIKETLVRFIEPDRYARLKMAMRRALKI